MRAQGGGDRQGILGGRLLNRAHIPQRKRAIFVEGATIQAHDIVWR
jgi:hypothetical protein